MASVVEIMNRALQKLGAKRITTIDEDSKNARSCSVARIPVLLAMLEDHDWNCAIKRVQLAADSTVPTWGKGNSFTLPSDFVRISNPYPEDNYYNRDFVIEGRKILTNEAAPYNLRYIYLIDDPNEMSALFREAYAATLALEMCEEITQSNTKKDSLKDDLKQVLMRARRANAIQRIPVVSPQDSWITARR